ncbi:hypothetical protein BC827DRAFT_244484 [Russula dissimulans]|nr:hypothetical protein BC827DRAFT_244484 [Russula dissimulans]
MPISGNPGDSFGQSVAFHRSCVFNFEWYFLHLMSLRLFETLSRNQESSSSPFQCAVTSRTSHGTKRKEDASERSWPGSLHACSLSLSLRSSLDVAVSVLTHRLQMTLTGYNASSPRNLPVLVYRRFLPNTLSVSLPRDYRYLVSYLESISIWALCDSHLLSPPAA